MPRTTRTRAGNARFARQLGSVTERTAAPTSMARDDRRRRAVARDHGIAARHVNVASGNAVVGRQVGGRGVRFR